MSNDRFESLEEITQHFTDAAVKSILRGTPLANIVSSIIVTAAGWGAENVRIYEEKYGPRKKSAKPVSGWRPMSTAPKDGTVIIVTETPNGEHWNVMPAAWMAQGEDNNDNNESRGRWWGITPSRSVPGEGPLYVRWKPLAMHPTCWMPMPEREDDAKLHRRSAAMRS